MYIKSKVISIIYKLIIIAAGVAGILIQMGVFRGEFSFGPFRYFTILSNFLGVVYFIPAVYFLSKNSGGTDRITFNPVLKGIITMGLTVTLLIAHFMLSGYRSGGTMGISLKLLHYIVPIMTIFDWILFDRKGQIKKYAPLTWVILPYLYLVYAMTAAQFGKGIGDKNRYPYPFLDVDKLGIGQVAITILLLTAGFLILGYIYYLIDYILNKIKINK